MHGCRHATHTLFARVCSFLSPARSWFFTFARCNDLGFEDVEYHIHTLESGESRWNEEFGANDLGLNSLYLCFFFVFTIMVGLNCRGAYKLQMRLSYLHPIVKWFLVIVVIEYISVFMMLIHYGSYSSNGVGVPTLLRVAQVLAIVSRCFFLFLLALLAKGYTISRDTVTYRWAVVGVILAWLGLSIFIFIWQQTLVDPKLTSPTSKVEAMTIVLNVIWLTFAAWFIAQVIASYRSETSQVKRSMYLKIGIAFAPWFIAPPLVSLAVFALDVRRRVVETWGGSERTSILVHLLNSSPILFLFRSFSFTSAVGSRSHRRDADDHRHNRRVHRFVIPLLAHSRRGVLLDLHAESRCRRPRLRAALSETHTSDHITSHRTTPHHHPSSPPLLLSSSPHSRTRHHEWICIPDRVGVHDQSRECGWRTRLLHQTIREIRPHTRFESLKHMPASSAWHRLYTSPCGRQPSAAACRSTTQSSDSIHASIPTSTRPAKPARSPHPGCPGVVCFHPPDVSLVVVAGRRSCMCRSK